LADVSRATKHLAELHAAAEWLWPALVDNLLEGAWTVEISRALASRFKHVPDPPGWADRDTIAKALVAGEMKPATSARC
jgi:hypothetical protein